MKITDKILSEIKAYQTIIVQRHQSPDPDALGSQGGLVEILKASFPKKNIYKVGGSVEDLGYLVEMDQIEDQVYNGALVIVTDTANAPRISDQRYALGEKIIKIDHHPDDEPYGDLSWVNTKASSCSEIIFDFYSACQDELKMTDEAARLLYGGIVGDTGRFLYPATTPHTMEVASKLMNYTFDATKLNRQINEITFNVAKLSGYVLEHLEVDEDGAAMVLLPQKTLKNYQVVDSQTAALIPLPGQVDCVKAWFIAVEQLDGTYRIRMRSKKTSINQIAKLHNGGGHPLASGARAKDLQEVNQIYREVQEVIKTQ
ncbi:bifunctional oligoribonuclease/PAP phosphatase NrnA [Vagococcus entomophilus]|uniref:DHH family phosphoesterase n=1 Tax=Vagococcus entomophilus TaxID=1160095 RepID=A0A430AKR3_9ENTE|nr:bifunctional oligoribonuclease/PAP phosphatase NrnA [Vagococcus entomophilus]RSU08675.1 DHH family phosphoesterase [Vagococcus entomophilus]